MPINVKENNIWREVANVYVNEDMEWKRCIQVYINNHGTWEELLFEFISTSNTITSGGAGTIEVPQGAFRVAITINGAGGGIGCDDGDHGTSPGGAGASLSATIGVAPYSTISYVIGTQGGNGVSGTSSAAGGDGGAGYNNGGDGGNAGPAGSSGGGGGGGGSTAVMASDDTIIMIAGGGSGGSGSGNNLQLSTSDARGKDSTSINGGIGQVSGSNGGAGDNSWQPDGGAGGGGGAGVPGGAGGAYLGPYDADGYPGIAGTSYYNSNLIPNSPTKTTNSGNGSITFTRLPE